MERITCCFLSESHRLRSTPKFPLSEEQTLESHSSVIGLSRCFCSVVSVVVLSIRRSLIGEMETDSPLFGSLPPSSHDLLLEVVF